MSEDPELQFVDSNVLIYAHDSSAGAKHDLARELLARLWLSEEGCLSIQVLQDFYVNVTQKVPRPLDRSQAERIIADLGLWRIHRPSVEDVLDAIRTQQRHGVSFWDAMILVSAQQLGCRTVWSEDLNPGQVYGTVTVVNPFA